MSYFFVLGSNLALSMEEIRSVLPPTGWRRLWLRGQVLAVETYDELDPEGLMSRLGGTIKVGRIVDQEANLDSEMLSVRLAELAGERADGGRLTFGYSIYAAHDGKAAAATGRLRRCGMEIKRRLKENELTSRWVRPTTGPALTSVSVAKNGLLSPGGAEFVIAVDDGGKRCSIGLTAAVQPFEEFSELDYGRPERDARRGMLPPKLARIMLNLARVSPDSTVWDPFCGSGTVISEALLLGVEHMFGSDVDRQAVKDAQANVDWLKDRRRTSTALPEPKMFVSDAAAASKEVKAGSISAIVTEPYLGRPRNGREDRQELNRRLNELTGMYARALTAWLGSLTADATLVLALPVYVDSRGNLMGVELGLMTRDGYELDLPPAADGKLTDGQRGPNGGLMYGRPGQFVWREIVRLRPKG
ncbi:MAG: 50S ribosomal protein L11 methyltransferase [bacterium]